MPPGVRLYRDGVPFEKELAVSALQKREAGRQVVGKRKLKVLQKEQRHKNNK